MKAARKAARRNAEENWLAYQRGKQYRTEKQDAHARPGNDNAKRDDQVSGKTDHRVSTARPIATRSLILSERLSRNKKRCAQKRKTRRVKIT